MGKERSPKPTRLYIRNHHSERDANGKQETENIGNETDGRKNVGVGWKERWVKVGWLTKQVNPMATWVRCGEKNGNLAPVKSYIALDGRAIRSTEWPLVPPNTTCSRSQQASDRQGSARERDWEVGSAGFCADETRKRWRLRLVAIKASNMAFRASEEAWDLSACLFQAWINTELSTKTSTLEFLIV